jgi:hypothetical protein
MLKHELNAQKRLVKQRKVIFLKTTFFFLFGVADPLADGSPRVQHGGWKPVKWHWRTLSLFLF